MSKLAPKFDPLRCRVVGARNFAPEQIQPDLCQHPVVNKLCYEPYDGAMPLVDPFVSDLTTRWSLIQSRHLLHLLRCDIAWNRFGQEAALKVLAEIKPVVELFREHTTIPEAQDVIAGHLPAKSFIVCRSARSSF